MPQKIIVSLTTTPQRIKYLDKTLEIIKAQSLQPDSIELNLPNEYRRANFGAVNIDLIPAGYAIFRCDDYGPATKLIPTLERYANTDTLIIFCDDGTY